MTTSLSLVQKYAGRIPRYTSYPPVPAWNNSISKKEWLKHISSMHDEVESSGVSLYLHLPFCEKLCSYCGCNKRITVNHKVEEPYIEDLLLEWEQYRRVLPKKLPIAELHLGGGTPTFFSARNLDLLLTKLLEGTVALNEANWSVEVHPSYTTEEQLRVLYNHGFRRLSLGVQTLDRKVQFLINRIQPFEEIEKLTLAARKIGFTSINFDILYGLPLQSLVTVDQDVSKLIELKPDRVAFYGYAHVPWKHAGQRRYTEKDLPSHEERFASAELGRQRFLEAGYEAIGMDHFALPTEALSKALKDGEMHRNFMGYTEQHSALMIGLGVSSISESPMGYVQNEKHIESFRSKLLANEDTFINGHRFNTQETETRSVILDVMCRMKLKESAYSNLNIQEELNELETDGILERCDDGYNITTAGLPFLRNVCSLIDPSFQPSSENRYSQNL